MKKYCFLMLPLIMIFACGCTNSSKTLARSLDNTISNLVYSVSNLDLLSASQISKVNSVSNSITKNINQYASCSSLVDDNDVYFIYNNDADDSDIQDEEKTVEFDKNAKLQQNSKNNDKLLKIDEENAENVEDQSDTTDDNTTPFGNKNFNNLAGDLASNYAGNNVGITEIAPSEVNTNYGDIYSSLETSSKKMESLINDLVNIRTIIMLYISDLYNGSISITQNDAQAINSYLNIIKEATAYLRSNNGSVNNHINEASQYLSSEQNSSLANSHIIRATEMLNTRCAKLESAIVATYNIASILQNTGTSTSSTTQTSILSGQSDEDFATNKASALSLPGQPNGCAIQYPYNQGYPAYGGINNQYYGNYGMNNGYAGYGTNVGFGNGYYQPEFNGYPYGGTGMYGGYYPNEMAGYGYYYPQMNYGAYGNNFGYGTAGLNGNYYSNYANGNAVVPNSTQANPVVPNVLTGLVSNDNQESLEDKLDNSLLTDTNQAIECFNSASCEPNILDYHSSERTANQRFIERKKHQSTMLNDDLSAIDTPDDGNIKTYTVPRVVAPPPAQKEIMKNIPFMD
ncbi:MAG: hypothetical protein IJS68_03735 [Clostridia bacterium]|nr:hypothetical protein [Clostridia bacterium]